MASVPVFDAVRRCSICERSFSLSFKILQS